MATTTLGYKPGPIPYRTPCNVMAQKSFSANLWTEARVKSDTVKRKRPKGVDLFFSPTYRQCSIQKELSTWAFPPLAMSCLAQQNPSVYKTGNVIPSYFKDNHGVSMPNNLFNRSTVFPRLKSKVLSKVKKDGLNVWMQLATYRQTATVWKDGVTKLWEIYRDIKRGRLRQGFKKTSEFYLYTRYALNPFLMDVESSTQQLAKELVNGQIKRFVATYETRVDYPMVLQNGARFFDSEAVKMSWTSLVEFDNELMQAAVNTGLTNVQFGLWDVVPFSFVVDWFIDIGSFLDHMDALFAVKRHVSWCVTRQVMTRVGLGANTMRYDASKRAYYRDVVDLGGLPPLRVFTGINLRHSLDSLNLLNANLRRS